GQIIAVGCGQRQSCRTAIKHQFPVAHGDTRTNCELTGPGPKPVFFDFAGSRGTEQLSSERHAVSYVAGIAARLRRAHVARKRCAVRWLAGADRPERILYANYGC